ncbi:MAG: hypothetical protein LBG12_09950 [Synergistaceae bacterium]|jgi:hypothetical protein|nr:hypothetical protein [Synergistaceae bacterium]
MSHSLHRYGPVESLRGDYCIYARAAKGVNRGEGVGDKLRKILEIYTSSGVVNFGSSHGGKSFSNGLEAEEYAKTLDNSYGVIATFDDRESVKKVLAKAKEANTGISIVVSGLIDEVVKTAHECGLKPHTATLSLGIFGKTEKLPENDVLEMVTMCGHSLVSSGLIKDVIAKVKAGNLSPEDAALIASKPCTCGIFNTSRCAKKFREILERESLVRLM